MFLSLKVNIKNYKECFDGPDHEQVKVKMDYSKAIRLIKYRQFHHFKIPLVKTIYSIDSRAQTSLNSFVVVNVII